MNPLKTILFIVFSVLILNQSALAQELNSKKANGNQNYIYKVKSLFEQGKFNEAIAVLDKIVKSNPRNARALHMRGIAKFLVKDFAGSLADYNKTLKIAPPKTKGVEEVYNNRGNLYYGLLQKDKAFADYDKALSINPDYQTAYVGRGNCFADKGNLDKALLDYNKAIELNSKGIAAYLGRADVYFMKNDLDKSFDDLEMALKLGGGFAATYLHKGIILGLKGYWFSAVENLRKGIEMNKFSSTIFSGNINVSLSDFDKYILKNSSNARVYAVRGLIKLLQNDKDEALKDLKKAFELDEKLKTELKTYIKPLEEKLND